jgi:hypothetical protein
MMTALVGGVIAFCNSAIISGAGLVLDRIRELLEERNSLLQEQERRQRREVPDKARSLFRDIDS